MGNISRFDVLEELTQFLRNQDVLTITVRGVTTTTENGTFSSDLTHLIANATIKNIRSITRGTLLALGTDYTYDTDFDDSGTKKTKITFTSAQTGSYTIIYDKGPDKIFPDFPKDNLSVSSYPRIAVIFFTVVVYADKTKTVNQTLDLIRDKFLTEQRNFVNLSIITPTDSGPMINDNSTKNEIVHANMDYVSLLNVEKI